VTDSSEPSPPALSPKLAAAGRIRQFTLVVIALFPVLFVASFALDSWRARGPDLGFAAFTRVELPAGIMTVSHTARMLHGPRRTQFWLLDGSRDDFRAFAAGSGLRRADEDARREMRADLFDGKLPELFEGYRGSLQGREGWLFVLYPGNQAVFQY
jgi:hypothetical protein